MITIREAKERGHADHGWLKAKHTFSFNTYHDPDHMGFRALRVINEDIIAPGQGFGTHPHRDMEIVTYVLDGALEHKDSMGNGSVIRPGDVQRMSAGTGIQHSEFNHSSDEPVHLLQIWILPGARGITPSYEQVTFSREDKLGQLRLMASPDGRDGSMTINQDANVYASVLEAGMSQSVPLSDRRHLWIQVVRGEARVNEHAVAAGDGVAVSGESDIVLTGVDDCELLLFEME